MTPSIDSWLTRFAAGAGSQYQWRIVRKRHHGKDFLLLRTFLPSPHHPDLLREMCPLSAQATLESGAIYTTPDFREAAHLQGFNGYSSDQPIVAAADGATNHDPDIRNRLLRICRLQED